MFWYSASELRLRVAALRSNDDCPPPPTSSLPDDPGRVRAPQPERESPAPVDVVSHAQPASEAFEELRLTASDAAVRAGTPEEPPQPELTPAEAFFSTAREAILKILILPMKDTEVAAALGVTTAQTKAWLQRLVDEGAVEKVNKPVRYRARVQTQLFDNKK